MVAYRLRHWPNIGPTLDRCVPMTEGYWIRIPARWDVCHRGCAYTVIQTVQMPGVCGAVYGTVYYREPL